MFVKNTIKKIYLQYKCGQLNHLFIIYEFIVATDKDELDKQSIVYTKPLQTHKRQTEPLYGGTVPSTEGFAPPAFICIVIVLMVGPPTLPIYPLLLSKAPPL